MKECEKKEEFRWKRTRPAKRREKEMALLLVESRSFPSDFQNLFRLSLSFPFFHALVVGLLIPPRSSYLLNAWLEEKTRYNN